MIKLQFVQGLELVMDGELYRIIRLPGYNQLSVH